MPVWGWVLIGIGCAIVLLAIIIIAWVIAVYNSLIGLRNNAEEGYSTMKV